MASSSGMARADEVMAKLGKARVKKAATNWSWEEEDMMYEMNTRTARGRRGGWRPAWRRRNRRRPRRTRS